MVDRASEFLQIARALIASGANEAVVRKKLEQYLPLIFPAMPWWVRWHAEGAEKHTKFQKDGSLRHGFVDTLIGSTPVEYEPNLAKAGVEDHAKDQIRDYVAGQINDGVHIDVIIGVISDTLRWKAYRAQLLPESEGKTLIGRDDVELEQIDAVDLSVPSNQEAPELRRFLERHLGRTGSRPLRGEMLANDIGLESLSGRDLRSGLTAIEQLARAGRPGYGDLIDRLWSELVDSIGRKGSSRSLALSEYLDEFYLVTLAKLICANVLDRAAINRPDDELIGILDGRFFAGKGLQNYVEYDLFGWLSERPEDTGMIEVARAIQDDLVAYDFASLITDDLFGQLLARLGKRSTRLILGQELTPPWLAKKMVEDVATSLDDDALRVIDTACGSGTILVEAIRYEAARPVAKEAIADRARRIGTAATGFDIDPLAALFAKTNWVIAMRDELPHLGEVAIPVFHADSLFAGLYNSEAEHFVVKLDDSSVAPPEDLLDADGRAAFDHILSSAYATAMFEAETGRDPDTSAAIQVARTAIALASDPASFDEGEVTTFVATLIRELALLQRDGRNGLWAYVIRNTSRAAQSFSQFNAMIINPPWLALSKIGDNPYAKLLDRLANELGVRPAGQSFLHTELSVIFLLEGVRRYLEPAGRFACILPSTVAEGHHQNRFRTGAFASARRPVTLDVDGIWIVPKGVFKNEAVILFGGKSDFHARHVIPGRILGHDADQNVDFHAVTAEYESAPNRVIWTQGDPDEVVGFGYDPAPFRQGADLMPRTAWFHDFQPYGLGRSKVQPIRSGGTHWYLLKDAKKNADFRLGFGLIVDNAFLFRAVLSNQLSPFAMAPADRLILPVAFNGQAWRSLTNADLAVVSQGTRAAFDSIEKALSTNLGGMFDVLNMMGKLRPQAWRDEDHIVLLGAGGAKPCAAWAVPGTYKAGETVFDQTVYWAPVGSLHEAAYLVGALNSPICADLIKRFQPRGAQGRRHVHKLPLAITPPYNATDEHHVELAEATISLVQSWRTERASDPRVDARLLPSQSNLQSRRRAASKLIEALPEWARYSRASSGVYGTD